MLDIIQTILTFCTVAWNKSVVFLPNQVLKFLSHEILGRPTHKNCDNFVIFKLRKLLAFHSLSLFMITSPVVRYIRYVMNCYYTSNDSNYIFAIYVIIIVLIARVQ